MIQLLQPHTVKIYHLEDKEYEVKHVKALSLLSVKRFDIYAKLYYAKYRLSEPEKALSVYTQHIKAFNPDGKEPGRDDKITFEAFVNTFNKLLDYFESNEFDDSISVVPVDKNGIILDGAHRVAALAFYNKEVTILQFKDVESKGFFDYQYFKDRGLKWAISDVIANEIPQWHSDILMACLWPQMGDSKCKDKGTEFLKSNYTICYQKEMALSLKTIQQLVARVYASQPWVNQPSSVMDKSVNCYGNSNRTVRFVMIQSALSLEETIKCKEFLREMYHSGKHSVHITDNVEETKELSQLVLTAEGISSWNRTGFNNKFLERMKERWYYFKKIEWINLKVRIYKMLHP